MNSTTQRRYFHTQGPSRHRQYITAFAIVIFFCLCFLLFPWSSNDFDGKETLLPDSPARSDDWIAGLLIFRKITVDFVFEGSGDDGAAVHKFPQLNEIVGSENDTILPYGHKFGGMETFWLLPSSRKQISVNNDIDGVVLLFHGCNHGASDWFTNPEEREVVRVLLRRQLAVVAFSSSDRTQRRCWVFENDEPLLRNALMHFLDYQQTKSVEGEHRWISFNHKRPALPLYAIGASSGGLLLSKLGKQDFWRTRLSAVAIYIAPAPELSGQTRGFPPVVFVSMEKDTFGDPELIPLAQKDLDHADIANKALLCHPMPVLPNLLSERIEWISPKLSLDFQSRLQLNGHLDTDAYLKKDPRQFLWQDLLFSASGETFSSQEMKCVAEVLNVCFGAHEFSRQYIDDVVDFLVAQSVPGAFD